MMTGDQVISLYETVSQITEEMLAAAQQRNWENLVVLESHCAGHIESLRVSEPGEPLSGPIRARKVEILHQILAHDRQIRDLMAPWMTELSSLINSAGVSRKLTATYGA